MEACLGNETSELEQTNEVYNLIGKMYCKAHTQTHKQICDVTHSLVIIVNLFLSTPVNN